MTMNEKYKKKYIKYKRKYLLLKNNFNENGSTQNDDDLKYNIEYTLTNDFSLSPDVKNELMPINTETFDIDTNNDHKDASEIESEILKDVEQYNESELDIISSVNENINPEYDKDDELIESTDNKFPFYIKSDDDSVEIKEKDSDSYLPKENNIRDIGMFGLARGKEMESFKFDDDNFIKFDRKNNKNKILKIDNIDDFDNFTDKYGKIKLYKKTRGFGKNDKKIKKPFLFIKWDKVAEDYKGIYLDEGINNDRYGNAYYKGELYESWWVNEYKTDPDYVFIFS